MVEAAATAAGAALVGVPLLVLGAGKTARDKALTLAEQASAGTRLSLLPAQPAPTADSSAAPPLSPAALRRAASVTSCTWRGSAVGPTG